MYIIIANAISAINRAYLCLYAVDRQSIRNTIANNMVLSVIDTLPVNAGINQRINGINEKIRIF